MEDGQRTPVGHLLCTDFEVSSLFLVAESSSRFLETVSPSPELFLSCPK